MARIDKDLVMKARQMAVESGGMVGKLLSDAARPEIERKYREFRRAQIAAWQAELGEAPIPPPPAPPSPPVAKRKGGGSIPKNMERDREIVAMERQGHSQRAIAEKFGLSIANTNRIITTARRKALAAEMVKEDASRTEETEVEAE